MIPLGNLLRDLPDARGGEITEILLAAPEMRIERIVSLGQASPPGFWYDQGEAEWVLLLAGRARLRFADESEDRARPAILCRSRRTGSTGSNGPIPPRRRSGWRSSTAGDAGSQGANDHGSGNRHHSVSSQFVESTWSMASGLSRGYHRKRRDASRCPPSSTSISRSACASWRFSMEGCYHLHHHHQPILRSQSGQPPESEPDPSGHRNKVRQRHLSLQCF